eukprot:5800560-Prymnesium_polylepis.1
MAVEREIAGAEQGVSYDTARRFYADLEAQPTRATGLGRYADAFAKVLDEIHTFTLTIRTYSQGFATDITPFAV